MSKPRQFTLGYLPANLNDGCDYFVVVEANPTLSFKEIMAADIKVIEHKAYEELEYRYELTAKTSDVWQRHAEKVEALCEKLATALEDFVHTDENGVHKSSPQCKCPALEQYRKFKGEK